MIQITESAARVIRTQLEKNKKPEGGLRIAVKAGGCSGFSYTFAWDVAAARHRSGVRGIERRKVFIDPRSLKLLDGTVLDFDENNLLATSFTLKNPHAKSTCGCGESFSA